MKSVRLAMIATAALVASACAGMDAVTAPAPSESSSMSKVSAPTFELNSVGTLTADVVPPATFACNTSSKFVVRVQSTASATQDIIVLLDGSGSLSESDFFNSKRGPEGPGSVEVLGH